MLVKGLIDICCDMSTSVNPTASRPTSPFESYAAPEPGQEPAMDAREAESDSVTVFTPKSGTACSGDSVGPKPEPAAEFVPAAPSNVTLELDSGSAVNCVPVPIAEPDLKKKKLTKKAKKKKRLELKKEQLVLAIAALEQAAEPEPGLLIDAAEPEPEPAVNCLSVTEVAPINATEQEPEPVPDIDWPAEPGLDSTKLEGEPSAEVAAEPQPDSGADSILEPNPEPEPEPAAETEEFSCIRPKNGKKVKEEKKSETQEDVCVWKATHLSDGG